MGTVTLQVDLFIAPRARVTDRWRKACRRLCGGRCSEGLRSYYCCYRLRSAAQAVHIPKEAEVSWVRRRRRPAHAFKADALDSELIVGVGCVLTVLGVVEPPDASTTT